MNCAGNCRQGRDACPHEEACDNTPPWLSPYWPINAAIAIGMVCTSAAVGFGLGYLLGL